MREQCRRKAECCSVRQKNPQYPEGSD